MCLWCSSFLWSTEVSTVYPVKASRHGAQVSPPVEIHGLNRLIRPHDQLWADALPSLPPAWGHVTTCYVWSLGYEGCHDSPVQSPFFLLKEVRMGEAVRTSCSSGVTHRFLLIFIKAGAVLTYPPTFLN